MLFEKAKLQFDLDSLRADLAEIRAKFEPVMVSSTYGGWSVTSSDGTYGDGWLKQGQRFTKVADDMSKEDYARYVAESGRMKPIFEYRKPTEVCFPYLKSVVETISSKGLVPCRVRLTLLKPGAATDWHRDAPNWLYCVRLHIPIVTNLGCTFENETEAAHLVADGSCYFLPVNNLHRVKNSGVDDRIHLIADIYDTEKFTENFHYEVPAHMKKP